MKKPHIIKTRSLDGDKACVYFRCFGNGVIAYGISPKHAYESWENRLNLYSPTAFLAYRMCIFLNRRGLYKMKGTRRS